MYIKVTLAISHPLYSFPSYLAGTRCRIIRSRKRIPFEGKSFVVCLLFQVMHHHIHVSGFPSEDIFYDYCLKKKLLLLLLLRITEKITTFLVHNKNVSSSIHFSRSRELSDEDQKTRRECHAADDAFERAGFFDIWKSENIFSQGQ